MQQFISVCCCRSPWCMHLDVVSPGPMNVCLSCLLLSSKETLNSALKNGNGPCSDNTARDILLCGQTVRVVISEKESAQTTSTLRQLLLRCERCSVQETVITTYINLFISSVFSVANSMYRDYSDDIVLFIHTDCTHRWFPSYPKMRHIIALACEASSTCFPGNLEPSSTRT